MVLSKNVHGGLLGEIVRANTELRDFTHQNRYVELLDPNADLDASRSILSLLEAKPGVLTIG